MELRRVNRLAQLALIAVWYTLSHRVLARVSRLGALEADTRCGLESVVMKCPRGSCCSEANFCGTTKEHCGGSQCQLQFSDSCDTFFGPEGPDTDEIPRSKVGNVPYGFTITGCSKPGTMALTFDDGPWKYTSQMLDLLDSLDVTATFFIAGNNKGKGHIDDPSTGWPDILRRMYNAGHQIGSHTWTHRDLNEVMKYDDDERKDLGPKVRKTEIMFNEMAFRNIFGWFPRYMRPPYLECSADCLKFLGEWGYHVISTNVDTKDYEYDDASLIGRSKKRFSDGVSENSNDNGYIVLAHDVHYQTVVNLTAYMVETARDRGYKLVTVGECLGDAKENWYNARSVERRSRGSPPVLSASETPSYSKPTDIHAPSPNQLCGGSTGYTCQGSGFGDCCSYYGYCGSGPAYCGTGCDAAFGTCYPVGINMSNTTNGLCGPDFAASCLYYKHKPCCSRYGYCGSEDKYCGAGCQGKYGTCT